jgi:hypothetical protein
MPGVEPPERGTLIMAALLLLALALAGSWIVASVEPGRNPRALLPWFGAAAAVIIALGLVSYLRSRRKDRSAK